MSDADSSIILPPPDLLPILNTTADYVARKGALFEAQILKKQSANRRFDFLQPSNPYHAFYRKRITEIKEGTGSTELTDEQKAAAAKEEEELKKVQEKIERDRKEKEEKKKTLLESIMDDLKTYKKPKPEFVDEPEADKYNVPLPDNIVAVDVDIIKLTAQYVARNGRNFLLGLTQREQHNAQFDFLKPEHPFFTYFERLMQAFLAVIKPPEELVPALKKHQKDIYLTRDELFGRAEFERIKAEKEEKAKNNAQADREAMALIDWHDFVVLETIDFTPEDEDFLPAPAMTIEEINANLDAEKNVQQMAASAGQPEEMDISDDDSDMEDEEPEENEDDEDKTEEPEKPEVPKQKIERTSASVPQLETPEERRRRQETARLGHRNNLEYSKCELCGEHIPLSELEEHIRIELLDPKWKEDERRRLQKQRESTLASAMEMGRNLAKFAKSRSQGYKRDDEKEPKKADKDGRIIWDGHSDSIRSVTTMIANKAMAERKAEMEGGVQRTPITKEALASKQAPPSRKAQNQQQQQQQNQQQRPQRQQQQQNQTPILPPAAFMRNLPFIQGGRVPFMPPIPPVPLRNPMQVLGVPPNVGGLPLPLQPTPPMQGRMGAVGGLQGLGGMRGIAGAGIGGVRGVGGGARIPPPQRVAMPPPPVGQRPPPPAQGQPPQKKQRLDGMQPPPPPTQLMDEVEFMRTHPPNVSVKVLVPHDPASAQWNFKGQELVVGMQITNTIADLKKKISDILGGLPVKKQKLRVAGGQFVKDNPTLAFYNIKQGMQFELALKARGGRGRK